MPNYVFISYSSKNQAAAESLKRIINKSGITTWMAPGDIPPGSKYAQVINRAIKDCACVVLMLTNDSQNSKWVPKELERAIHYQKTIIPIQLENVVLNDEFEFYLSTNQIIAVQRIHENSPELRQVISSISSIVGNNSTVYTPQSPTLDAELPNLEKHTFSDAALPNLKGYHFSDVTLIGQGLVGRVYHAYDQLRGKDYAIKRYSLEDAFHIPLFSDDSLSFDLKVIQHPNICRIIDVVRGSEPCVIMDFIQGINLKAFLSQHHMGMLDRLIAFKGILEALEVLHRKDIFHGDLRPANIIVTSNRFVLCDFSEANYSNSRLCDKTIFDYKFRSPEKLMRSSIDTRSDIFEAGMLLDELTFNLISDETVHRCFFEERNEIQYSSLEGYREDMLPIARIIQSAIPFDADLRYASVSAMINDISEIIHSYF